MSNITAPQAVPCDPFGGLIFNGSCLCTEYGTGPACALVAVNEIPTFSHLVTSLSVCFLFSPPISIRMHFGPIKAPETRATKAETFFPRGGFFFAFLSRAAPKRHEILVLLI